MPSLDLQPTLIAALCDPQHSPLGAPVIRIAETHISWVLLTDDHAWKIKKVVDLGFLDFTTLAARHFYCEEELRLNRRLAPQLYLDVVAIGGTPGEPVLGAQPAIEYAVQMRRFADDRLLDQLLARGELTPQHLDALANTMAEFHHGLPPAAAESDYGSASAIHVAALQNFEQTLPLLRDEPDRQRLSALRDLCEAEFARCAVLFAARHAQGKVRECHGDLHLANIVLLDGRPVPFDGIEFDAGLRWMDPLNEIAFLMMDLLHRQQPALAYRFLNAYLEASGDYDGIDALPFYLAYRAMVRAKIAAIRASQTGQSEAARHEKLQDCHAHLALAERCLAPRRAALILTHGLPGSGKSTFAQEACARLGAIRIRSDVERKRLHGLGPLDSSRSAPNADLYSMDATQRTYARLLDLARILLAAGFPVVVDAAFLKQEERAPFQRLAQQMNVPFAIAALQADYATLQRRIIERNARGQDASEADLTVLDRLLGAHQPLTATEQRHSAAFTAAQPGWESLQRLISARQAEQD